MTTPTPAASAPQSSAANPLLEKWDGPFGLPPFSRIKPEHFLPAFEQSVALHKAEIEAIANNPAAPTFDNTIAPLELAGESLGRVTGLLHHLVATTGTPELREIEQTISPRASEHHALMAQNEKLFPRIEAVHDQRDNLEPEQKRLVEKIYLGYRLSGAALKDEAQKTRYVEIAGRLSELTSKMDSNLSEEMDNNLLYFSDVAELAGVPQAAIDRAKDRAQKKGHEGQYALTLIGEEVRDFLRFAQNRSVRERVFNSYVSRGARDDEYDNRALLAEIITLRQEQATLLGFASYAHLSTADKMAQTPEPVMELLQDIWSPALAKYKLEREVLQQAAHEDGMNDSLQAWDWSYYAEKVRQRDYALNENEIRDYLQIDNVIQGVFDSAEKLLGIKMIKRPDLETYHPDATPYEVQGKNGEHIGIFWSDPYAREGKRAGAWMSELQGVCGITGHEQRPFVVNVCNNPKAAHGPTLISLNEAYTFFHEFGHALHGLMSRATYPSLTGTNVPWDFVELPSQLFEQWATAPEVMKTYYTHHQTAAPMPDELIGKIKKAHTFNQGYATLTYLTASLTDMELHLKPQGDAVTIDTINTMEKTVLAKYGAPENTPSIHRLPHFGHIIGGYAAGYYVYLWADVLSSDAYAAFENSGDIFNPALAEKLPEIYAAGDSRDPYETYRAFRGQDATRDALLKDRGLDQVALGTDKPAQAPKPRPPAPLAIG